MFFGSESGGTVTAIAALPLQSGPKLELILSQVAEQAGFFTGAAFLSNNSNALEVKVEVFGADGKLTGENTVRLESRQKMAKIVRELVPEALGQTGGYVRVTAKLADSELEIPVGLFGFGLFGTTELSSLSAVPIQ